MNKDEKISLALYLIEQTRRDAKEMQDWNCAPYVEKLGKLLERILANADILEGLVTGDSSKIPVSESEAIPHLESV